MTRLRSLTYLRNAVQTYAISWYASKARNIAHWRAWLNFLTSQLNRIWLSQAATVKIN